MSQDLPIKNGITIPEHELEYSTSRGGGPGGQHVNKTSTKVSIRWNVRNTQALNEIQKNIILEKLASRLTVDGDLIVQNNASRSQAQNKDMARAQLAHEIRKALHVPKKRIKTKISAQAQEKRLAEKSKRSLTKKMRSKKIDD